ncbi:MAG: glycosyltransferase family 39 protein [Proteobacteria bacterium]|nr:glycosyltransferase family 39 protein [Pseudomonadota bacterium]
MNSRRTAPWGPLAGAVLDLAVFLLALKAGWHYGSAHVASFGIACLALALGGWLRGSALPLPALAAIDLMALLLRGGVLVLLVGRFGVPPGLAILPALLASGYAMRQGEKLCAERAQLAPGSGQRWRALAIALGVYSVALRLTYMGSVDLFPEEAYYWNYAQHMDYGYLDHPPMVAWLIRAGTALFGNGEFGVRIGALVCTGIAAYFVYRSTRELYGRASALTALVLMQLLPAYLLSGMFMTPDTPLVAAWAAALYFLQRALLQGEARAWWGAGVALGLGMVSKYTIALLVPATLLFVLLDAPARAWLRRWPPYAAGALALLLFSPVILWNAHHEWASFAFQTAQRLAEKPRFSLLPLIASIVGLLSPVVFAALPALLRPRPADAVAGDPPRRRLRFVQVFTLLPLSVFVLFSLRHTIKLDWTGALWVALVPALAHAIVSPSFALPRWVRRSFSATAVVLLLLYGGALHYLTLGPPGVPYSRDLLSLPFAWRDLGEQVDGLAGGLRTPGGPPLLVVGMNRYMVASELAFYARDPVRAARSTTSQNLFGLSGLMYERWFPNAQQQGKDLLLVALQAPELDAPRLQPYVGSLGPLHAGVLRRNGRTVGEYFYRAARDYRAVPGR